ncbi:iron ABC transporter permease [soil metagenome]
MTKTHHNWRRAAMIWAALFILLLVTVAVCLMAGQEHVDLRHAFHSDSGEFNVDRQILLIARLPRVLFAVVAGAALALAGAVYQALLRNDLADPYTLGVSGGASFGAVLILNFASLSILPYLLPLGVFAMALLTVAAIQWLAQLRNAAGGSTRLVLAGVTLNMLFGAAILLVEYLSDPHETFTIIRWTMGGTDVGSLGKVGFSALILMLASAFILPRAGAMNLFTLGDTTAAHLGVDVRRERRALLAAASLLAAGIVAYAGPIGFIGLLVPHALRLILGPDHRVLLPATLFSGGTFLVVCDTLGRTIRYPLELPVGIVTAFLGAPFFLWLLFRRAPGERA